MLGIKKHLDNCIIPFWKRLIDNKHGGFFGEVTNDLLINEKADKSIIAHTRYLYTFSLWYNMFKDDDLIPFMNHSYDFLKKAFYDEKYNGFYWMVDYKGQVKNATKHVYGQAFVIYALAEYGKATKREDIIEEAYQLFLLIDKHAYHYPCHFEEQFTRDWMKTNNSLLAAHGDHLPYTTNSLLHVLEAYTNLYSVRKDDLLKERMIELLNLFVNKLYNKENQSFYMYLDQNKHVSPIGQSYGHDIETCWLIDRTLEVLNHRDHDIEEMTRLVAEKVYDEAMTKQGLISEKIEGNLAKDRIWWIQVEAMVGFMNQYQKTKDPKYLEAVKEIYRFTQDNLVDVREGSEWFWGIDEHQMPIQDHGIAEAWKAPYHNGRAFVELLKRGLK